MIFVAGVSRSGKSHTIETVSTVRNFTHLRASRLLREAGRPLGPLSRAQAEENQRVLAELLMAAGQTYGRRTILDGHVMIETTEGPFPVPDGIFDQIRPTSIICITDDPAAIAGRRADQGWTFDRREIERLQHIEIRCAQHQAARLDVPYHAIQANDIGAFLQAVGE
jgi:adenylate kinase